MARPSAEAAATASSLPASGFASGRANVKPMISPYR